MAIKTPPNNFIVLSHGKENAKKETVQKTGEPNARWAHVNAIGPAGTRQTVEELEASAPKAKMNLRWELRDGYCSIINPETGEDVSEEYSAPGVRKMDDPEYEAKRAAAKEERERKAAEKKAEKEAKGESGTSSESPVGDPPTAHEDHPDDVEACVNDLMASNSDMTQELAEQVVRENGVAATREAFLSDVQGEDATS